MADAYTPEMLALLERQRAYFSSDELRPEPLPDDTRAILASLCKNPAR